MGMFGVLGAFTGAFRSERSAMRWVPWLEKAVGVLLVVAAPWFVQQFLLAGGPSALFG